MAGAYQGHFQDSAGLLNQLMGLGLLDCWIETKDFV